MRTLPSAVARRNFGHTLVLFIVAALVAQPVAALAARQDGTPPADPAITALESELKRAKLEADIAASRRAAFESSLPKTTTTPLDGTTSIDDKVQIESEMMAYEAVDEIAAEIRCRVRSAVLKDGATVVIHDEATVAALRLYEVFLTQAAILENAYASLDEPAPTALFLPTEGVAAFARSAFDLLALFRQNTEYKGLSITINEDALVSKIAGYLVEPIASGDCTNKSATHTVQVICPRLMLRDATHTGTGRAGSAIVKRLGELYARKRTAEARISAIEKRLASLRKTKLDADAVVADLDLKIRNLQLEIAGLSGERRADKLKELSALTIKRENDAKKSLAAALALQEAEATDGPIRDQYRVINGLVDQLTAGLVKTDEKSGVNALGLLTKAQDVVKYLDAAEGNTYVLFTKSVTAGGSYRIRRNLWTTVFTGDMLSYSGGAVVCFMLFDNGGKTISADTLRYMTGFTKFKKLPKSPKGDNFKTSKPGN